MKRFIPEPIHGFTTEELTRLRRIIDRSWDMIADDLFSASCFDVGMPDSYDKWEVAEISLDADRWKFDGHEEGDKNIINKLRELGWYSKEWNEVIDNTLPYQTYCY